MSEKIRTALIGCGKRGNLHASAVTRDERFDLCAVCDIDPEAIEKLTAKYCPDAARYDDYNKMLAEVKPDLVIQALWPEHRLAVYKACISNGVKHMVSEKPMAPSFSDALEMKNLASMSDCRLSFTHQRRFSVGNRRVRELLAAGAIGEVKRIDLYAFRHLLDCGTHTLDQVWSYIGDVPVEWVMGSADLTETVKWFDVPGEGSFTGTIKYKNGLLGSIFLGVEGVRPDLSGVTLWGSQGYMELDWEGKLYSHASATMQAELDDFAKMTPGEACSDNIFKMWQHIADCWYSGTVDELNWLHAFNAVEVIFALYQSALTNRRVELPLTGVTENPLYSML